MQIDLTTIIKVTGAKVWNNFSFAEDLHINYVQTDSRIDLTNSLFVALKGEIFDAHNFLGNAVKANATALCVNKNVDIELIKSFNLPILMVEDTLLAYQQIANYHRHTIKDLIVVGVTGSVGKTSSKEILRAIGIEKFGESATLSTIGNTNNQVGVPQNLLRLNPQHKIAIIEMGTNHFGEILPLSLCTNPDIAIINSIAPCHLENLIDLAGVAREKSDIFRGVKTGGLALISSEAPCREIMTEMAKNCSLNVGYYGSINNENINMASAKYLTGNLDSSTFEIIDHKDNITTQVNWNLTGEHQANNATAAYIVGKHLGLSNSQIANALSKTTLVGMRMKKSVYNGVTYINDAYNANPLSMKATLQSIRDTIKSNQSFLILGDMLELGDCAVDEHAKILEFVLNEFETATIIAVGPIMENAGKKLIITNNQQIVFAKDSNLAYSILESKISEGCFVFLKGSRGMKLENAINEGAR